MEQRRQRDKWKTLVSGHDGSGAFGQFARMMIQYLFQHGRPAIAL
jgi:hypothetical protein